MSRIFKNTVKIIGLFTAAFILCCALFASLPHFVQKIINNTLAEKKLPFSLTVRDVGFWGSDLSVVSVGAGKSIASIDSIRLDYSPLSLLQKKLTKISLTGLELNLHFLDGKLIVPWPSAQETNTSETIADTSEELLASLANLGEISIEHALINVSSGNLYYSVPCSMAAQISKTDPGLITVRAELMLREQPVLATAVINPENLEMRLDIDADSLELLRFADLIKTNNDLAASGRLAFKAKIHLGLKPLSIITAEIAGQLAEADFTLGELRLTNIHRQDEQPFLFNLTVDKDTGRLTSTSLALGGLIAAEVGGLNLSLANSEKGLSFDGAFSINIPAQKTAASLAIAPIDLVTKVNGMIDKDLGWQAQAAAAGKHSLGISQAGLNMSAQITDYSLTAFGKADQTTLKYNVKLSPFNVQADNFSIKLPEVSASGTTSNGKSTFVVPFENVVFTDNADFSGHAGGEILFGWPYQAGTENGEIHIDQVQMAGIAIGSLDLSLQQMPLGFKISGRNQNALIDTLCIDLTGHADFIGVSPAAELIFHNGCDKSFKNLDLGRFSQKLSGVTADAELTLNGNLIYEDGRVSGKIDSQIDNIRLASLAKEFTLTGGALEIHMTELPKIKTGPKQRISFQSLKLGKITADNGLVEFQIESPESIFIEKGAVQWSDGHVYTQALRFSPKVKDYDLIFFCDRLHFAKLLEQLGAATADGQGRVNGRVPMRITDGKFFIENGFLYSTPGEGGKIKLTGTDRLTAGIPPNTPQFAQIDLAREALRDFSYDWTKLDINSESAENLLLHLQINGKPSNPLPFVYSQEFGGFARVDASSPGSRFQGIKLDVNFRLPLNEVLHYGDSIKSLME